MVSTISKDYQSLTTKYTQLLQQAEQATNRKEALSLIHEADRVRYAMTNHEDCMYHPCMH